MQIYLPGVTPTFWREVNSLPTGIYKKEFDQAVSTPIRQLFVSFLNRPVGTIVGIYMGEALVATAKVIDESGMIYARITLPHTYGQDDIDMYVKDMATGVVVERSSFSTSNIDLVFEMQAKLFDKQWAETQQIEEDATIEGVEGSLLEQKFGVFTGLSRRNDQTELQYRNQTACLWKSFRYSSMEKGLIDSIRCLLGQNISITVSKSKDAYANEIFDVQQYVGDSPGNEGYFPPSVNLVRASWKNPPANTVPEKPHFYVHDRPDDFYLPPIPAGNKGIDIILNGNDAFLAGRRNVPWDTDIARSFTINSNQAIGNEVIVDIDELDALVSVANEDMHRQDSLTDQMTNINIASITIASATTGSGNLPIEDVDFVLNRLTGIITWLYPYGLTTQTPETDTTYTVSYSFRLDEAIRTIVRQIKPAQKSVIIKFNVSTMIPWFSEYFDARTLGDLNGQNGWSKVAGVANSVEVTATSPIQGSKSGLIKQGVGITQYVRDLASLKTNYDIFWDLKYSVISPSTYMTVLGMSGTFLGIQWSVSMDGNGNVYLDHLGSGFPGTLIGTANPADTNRFRVRVTPDGIVRVYRNNFFLSAKYVKTPAIGTRHLGLQAGIGTERALIDEITSVYYTTSPSRLPLAIEV